MKKYMVAEDIELLKEFGISQVETTINFRCDRIICADCNSVFRAVIERVRYIHVRAKKQMTKRSEYIIPWKLAKIFW